MPTFNLRDIEFKSDGLVDSLTLSISPLLFHENLKREISIAGREVRELTIVSINLHGATLPKNPSQPRQNRVRQSKAARRAQVPPAA